MRILVLTLTAVTGIAAAALPSGTTAILVADRDGTLYEEPDGATANGAGPSFFAGRILTGENTVRRGLLHFNVPPAFPTKQPSLITIESVTLVLTVITEPPGEGPREYRLHRLLADWGEGASSSSPGGAGTTAERGDATWIHTSYPDAFWLHNGGQFEGEPSARFVVDGPHSYRIADAGMARDVKLWSEDPSRNFGWILIGDETERQTARAFASREHTDPASRPMLEIAHNVVTASRPLR